MAAIPVTIIGTMTYSDTQIGGGPMPGGPPLGFWGGAPLPWPSHPIAPGGPPPVPTHPIYFPPVIWPNPPEGQAPIPSHPIVIPPDQPPGGGGGQPPAQPPVQPVVGWGPNVGWFVIYVPTPGTPVVTPSKPEETPPPA